MEGDWPNAVTISNRDVMVLSNNDVTLRSKGEGVKKVQKLRSHLMYDPYK